MPVYYLIGKADVQFQVWLIYFEIQQHHGIKRKAENQCTHPDNPALKVFGKNNFGIFMELRVNG
jgi:hypothetical protein